MTQISPVFHVFPLLAWTRETNNMANYAHPSGSIASTHESLSLSKMCAAAGENYSKIFSVKSCRQREDIVSDEGREGSRVNVNPHPPSPRATVCQ